MSGWRKRGFGKHEYYRDKKLLELAEGELCLLQVAKNCLGGDGSTTVANSLNFDKIQIWLPLAGEKQIESLPAISSMIRT